MQAETLSTTLQELWVGEAVMAGLVDDVLALLQAGFEAAPETLQDIRLRAEGEISMRRVAGLLDWSSLQRVRKREGRTKRE
jgi:hypothetical protein